MMRNGVDPGCTVGVLCLQSLVVPGSETVADMEDESVDLTSVCERGKELLVEVEGEDGEDKVILKGVETFSRGAVDGNLVEEKVSVRSPTVVFVLVEDKLDLDGVELFTIDDVGKLDVEPV